MLILLKLVKAVMLAAYPAQTVPILPARLAFPGTIQTVAVAKSATAAVKHASMEQAATVALITMLCKVTTAIHAPQSALLAL